MTKELNFFQNDNELLPSLSSELLAASVVDRDDYEEMIEVETHVLDHLKRVIEALLFVSQDPISLSKIRDITNTVVPLKPRQLRGLIDQLQQEYITSRRAFRVEEIAEGYVLRTHEEYSSYIELLYRQKRGEKLSSAATEVLAIVAYRQPITRPQIDAIRGIDSSGTMAQLIERNLVEAVGRLEAPGRPALFGTTKEFLKHFGLKHISDLRTLSTQ